MASRFKLSLRGDNAALLLLFLVALLFWGRVLFTNLVLLPGGMLNGFLPFGQQPEAPWVILQWDSLAQYYPWRHFAGEELRSGHIPLWNPFQFSGTPFVANAQSAVFYPLNLPFWIFDTARAFGIAAFLHTLLASIGTYFLARRWQMSRGAAVLSAIGYALSGYLMAWALLPTLFATAAWLPLCLLLFEKAVEDADTPARRWAMLGLALSLCCALLAGHAQIFFYVLMALALRQPFLRRPWRGLAILGGTGLLCLALGALQLLPTLELAQLGHRQAAPPTAADWSFWQPRALQLADFQTLFLPGQPSVLGTLNENFGYIGFGLAALALAGIATLVLRTGRIRPRAFALTLLIFGLLYAMATPLAKVFFFGVPGISQMGGTGRALLLWSLGAALLAGFGLDLLKQRLRFAPLPTIALLLVAVELGANGFFLQPTAPKEQIYPRTALTDWLKSRVNEKNRVLFFTPRGEWLPAEGFQPPKNHPLGVLPPNGSMVYRLHDVNGYDSLSPRIYRQWVGADEEGGPSPALNGNMVLLNNLQSPVLDSLQVRYLVTPSAINFEKAPGKLITTLDGCNIWERSLTTGNIPVDGRAFYPGWKGIRYAPETFRLGVFISLVALGFVAAAFYAGRSKRVGPSVTIEASPTG